MATLSKNSILVYGGSGLSDGIILDPETKVLTHGIPKGNEGYISDYN